MKKETERKMKKETERDRVSAFDRLIRAVKM